MVIRALRESAHCILSGPSIGSMWRRFRFPAWRDWLTPSKALLFIAVRPYTMLPYGRLNQLYYLAERCNIENIPGAFVQCGVWKGGSAAVLAALRCHRVLWLFDSFEGCPNPGDWDIPTRNMPARRGEACASINDVSSLLHSMRLDSPDVKILPGWFDGTIPPLCAEVGPIALLHLDADFYASTHICMDYLYPNVVTGGFIYVDDLGYWAGCAKAVQEYFEARDMDRPQLHWVDQTGAWWQKAS